MGRPIWEGTIPFGMSDEGIHRAIGRYNIGLEIGHVFGSAKCLITLIHSSLKLCRPRAMIQMIHKVLALNARKFTIRTPGAITTSSRDTVSISGPVWTCGRSCDATPFGAAAFHLRYGGWNCRGHMAGGHFHDRTDNR